MFLNIVVDVFDDVLQNAKHHANNASNDVNLPPQDDDFLYFFYYILYFDVIKAFFLLFGTDLFFIVSSSRPERKLRLKSINIFNFITFIEQF